MDEATRISIENRRKLNNYQRRAFNVRINGEEHHATSRNGKAQIHFPLDGQKMQISELAFKIIINDGIRAGGSSNPTDDPYNNWSYGLQTYKTYQEWLNRYPVGSRVNVDNAYDCQCWDYAAAFWSSQTNSLPSTGPLGYAYEMWTVSAQANTKGGAFELIYRWQDIRPGDWVIWGTVGFGHVAMATGCTNSALGSIPFRDQNGPQGMVVGTNIYSSTMSNGNKFLGAFRYKDWSTPSCGTQIA